jgi:predicted Zn finger-like uncharacterized protein
MILGLEIGMLIAGIVALVTGKLHLSKTNIIRGPAARLAGAMWVVPLPLALLVVFIILASMASSRGHPPTEQELKNMQGTFTIIELAILVGFLILGIVLALVGPRAPEPRRRRRRDEDWEEDDWEEEDRPVARRRPRYEDEDDDRPAPRRRPRYEDEEEDEDRPAPRRSRSRDEFVEAEDRSAPRRRPPEERPPADAPVVARCPACQASYRLDPSFAGRKVRCRQCQEVFSVE